MNETELRRGTTSPAMMYATYIVRRTQIYLEESQHETLSTRAAAVGSTTSELIREAVDAYLAGPQADRGQLLAFREAVRAVAGSVPRLPEGSSYVNEMRAVDLDREQALERRRRP